MFCIYILIYLSVQALWSIAKKRNDAKTARIKIQTYEEAFETIKTHTGIDSINNLVKEFQVSEEKNYDALRILNELQDEYTGVQVCNKDGCVPGPDFNNVLKRLHAFKIRRFCFFHFCTILFLRQNIGKKLQMDIEKYTAVGENGELKRVRLTQSLQRRIERAKVMTEVWNCKIYTLIDAACFSYELN